MNVRQIVKQYLAENGYGGLVLEGDECGCELDDLVPCDHMSECCEAGYREECSDDCSCEHGRGWHITTRKPVEKK